MANPGGEAAVENFWQQVKSERLAQGDLLPNCNVPIVPHDFGQSMSQTGPVRVRIDVLDLIVMTQSCDLENDKAPLVACCPIHTLGRFEEVNPKFAKAGAWESVRQGRQEGLHILGSPVRPADKWDAYVVDFRGIYSLPIGYMSAHAGSLGPRWRLRPPYLEHFSQAFARFFMRVGLPTDIPSYVNPPTRPPAAPGSQN